MTNPPPDTNLTIYPIEFREPQSDVHFRTVLFLAEDKDSGTINLRTMPKAVNPKYMHNQGQGRYGAMPIDPLAILGGQITYSDIGELIYRGEGCETWSAPVTPLIITDRTVPKERLRLNSQHTVQLFDGIMYRDIGATGYILCKQETPLGFYHPIATACGYDTDKDDPRKVIHELIARGKLDWFSAIQPEPSALLPFATVPTVQLETSLNEQYGNPDFVKAAYTSHEEWLMRWLIGLSNDPYNVPWFIRTAKKENYQFQRNLDKTNIVVPLVTKPQLKAILKSHPAWCLAYRTKGTKKLKFYYISADFEGVIMQLPGSVRDILFEIGTHRAGRGVSTANFKPSKVNLQISQSRRYISKNEDGVIRVIDLVALQWKNFSLDRIEYLAPCRLAHQLIVHWGPKDPGKKSITVHEVFLPAQGHCDLVRDHFESISKEFEQREMAGVPIVNTHDHAISVNPLEPIIRTYAPQTP